MARPQMLGYNVRPQAASDDDDPGDDYYDNFDDDVDPYTEYDSGDDPYAAQRPMQDAILIPVQDDSHEDEEDDVEGAASEDDKDKEEVQQQITRTSFGALKQAQDTLAKKRKRGSETNEDQEEKLAALRSRLDDLRSKSESTRKQQDRRNDGAQTSSKRNEDVEDEYEDSDSAPSEIEAPSKSRTSKHAPGSQSSRYQVTRKRNVIDVPKRTYRDPRFDAIHNQPTNLKDNSDKAYAFLTDYQKSEIRELRTAIKATKSEDEKETLRRKMVSMENRLKSKAAKDREQEVVRKHRREEREKVEQGKQPYYLKQKDVKQKALEEKYKGMKGKEREKLMERRRKKEGQAEKRNMPMARRVER